MLCVQPETLLISGTCPLNQREKQLHRGCGKTPLVVRQRAKYCLDSKLKHTGQAQIQSMLVMVYLWEATLKIAHGRTGPVVKQIHSYGECCVCRTEWEWDGLSGSGTD